MKKIPWLLLALIVAGVDQAIKYWALSSLYFYQSKPLLPFLNLTLAQNTGAAFSFLSQSGQWHLYFFTALSAILIIGFGFWLFRLKSEAKWQSLAISFIMGGALGNLIDRIHLGFVVDFIDFHFKTHHFAVFNFADAFICIGAFLLILSWKKAT